MKNLVLTINDDTYSKLKDIAKLRDDKSVEDCIKEYLIARLENVVRKYDCTTKRHTNKKSNVHIK